MSQKRKALKTATRRGPGGFLSGPGSVGEFEKLLNANANDPSSIKALYKAVNPPLASRFLWQTAHYFSYKSQVDSKEHKNSLLAAFHSAAEPFTHLQKEQQPAKQTAAAKPKNG
jgi:hypothetical protein